MPCCKNSNPELYVVYDQTHFLITFPLKLSNIVKQFFFAFDYVSNVKKNVYISKIDSGNSF